jgi:hypothetical protein
MKQHPKIRAAYRRHRGRAKKHGIRWRFTFQSWVTTWETALGPDWFQKRGCTKGKYVMARNGDKGMYSPRNIHIVPCEVNHKETIVNGSSNWGEKNGRAKLTTEEVRAIFVATGTQDEIARRFNTKQERVCRIKKRQTWVRVTKDL